MFFIKGFIDFLTIFFRRPKFAAMTAIMTFVVFVILGVYGMRVITDIPVYVVDHDNTTVSRTIRLFLDSGPDLKVLGTLDSLEEAKDILYQGEIAAVIYIPEGTSQAVKTQSGARVFSYIDGTNMLMAKNADKAIQTVVKTASVGISMIAMQKQGLPKPALMGALQPINLDVDRPFNALTVYSEYLLPVLVFFNLNIFVCVMTCACFQEKLPPTIKAHKYRRRFFYFGRLAVIFIIAFLIGLLIYQYGLPRVDIVLQSAPIMALSSLFVYILLTMMLFACINLLLPVSVSMSLSYLTCMLSVMFSGLTWPLEMMPWYLREFASWIPMTPFLQSVQVFLYHDATWSDLWIFYQMFIKQIIFYTILVFVIIRMHDIVLIIKWAKNRIKGKKETTASLEMAAAGASPALSEFLLHNPVSNPNNADEDASVSDAKPHPDIDKANAESDELKDIVHQSLDITDKGVKNDSDNANPLNATSENAEENAQSTQSEKEDKS